MTIQCIRFISGENVIADVLEESAESITINDAIVAVPTNQDGTQIGFMPFAPLQDPNEESLTIDRRFVMYVATLSPELETQYNKMFNRTEIVTPKKQLIL